MVAYERWLFKTGGHSREGPLYYHYFAELQQSLSQGAMNWFVQLSFIFFINEGLSGYLKFQWLQKII